MSAQELELIEEDTSYHFAIAPGEAGGKLLTIQSQTLEAFDKTTTWRAALHPWMGGLAPNRINPAVTFGGDLRNRPSMSYAKANGDASNPNYFTAPPKITSAGTNVTVLFYNTAAQLRYGGSAYGTFTYTGAAPSSSDITKIVRNFNGKAYMGAGQYLLSLDADYTLSTVKDFGAGKIVYDIEPFNNELIIAMGESEKIWKMSTAEVFAQASDDVYAIALGRVDDKLWRAHDTNELDNCLDTPLTLASYVPTDPYTCGDTTYSITDLVEYGGIIACVKPDGVYFPDGDGVFHNQTPQLRDYPHTDNGRGTFTSGGYLYVPSVTGFLQVSLGESIPIGPELSGRPDFRFWVRAGVEWGGDIYLVCTDEAGVEPTFICKMMVDKNGLASTPYIYHEWLRFENADPSYIITVFTTPTNPTMIAGQGAGIHYWKMGRGAGVYVDDSNYEFGEDYELDTGDFVPVDDRGLKVSLNQVKIIGKQPEGSSLEVLFDMDREGTFRNLLTSQEGGGTEQITESGFFNRTLYAPPNTTGNIPRIKLVGTLPAGIKGDDRPEIYEVWASGNVITETTDILTIGVYSDINAKVRGIRQGRKTNNLNLFSEWHRKQTVLQLRIPGYAPGEIVRGVIIDISDSNIFALKSGNTQVLAPITKIVFRRVDFEGVLLG